MGNKELIEEIKAGNRAAFDDACGQYYLPLLSYARLFLGDNWAEDVVQDVLANVWVRRGGVRF